MRTNRILKIPAIMLLFICSTVKAEVIEIKPEVLVGKIETQNNTVVQFTSPDKNCRHCIGADSAFDNFADNHTGNYSFLRVQWSPWNKTPEAIKKEYRIVGLPMHICYRDGKEVKKLFGSIKAVKSDVVQHFKDACFK
ncbi:MAG: hypothetical protein KME56_17440 [Candidatus Thiodiazotropha sp. (ex Ctena orbiculata)]|uniref:Thioredoxin domain-containing protein n=1 Tax=Candidatus Thiodiazotropha taylori TaxID=2792791 RepID=A0A944ME04_9GAMM|nr:hypothetical protein [Candidatus Thiodiazotropha taylori]PUB83449.1 MAG: hypothetical protein DBP00_15990 [gamma proteobacterium symbiont of Ctena orbiculata]MBT2990128.1 hypothetical protein [Candidatus Thiodiazotropha taylori]MBT2998401.1 hypothetical protein [Candidatus Thiodiazotropha taylori]MBT3000308.1 hypothetical protein [Candidatus Thiodiazotropha taylori]